MISDAWRKSSYSGGGHQNCLECRSQDLQILLRDSQHPDRCHLAFSHAEWAAFVHAARGNAL